MSASADAASAPFPTQRTTGGMNRRDFFDEVVSRVRATLSPELAVFRHRANPMLLKLDYENERIHFEVWPDAYRSRVEIGLHFEDGPASTAVYLAFFDARIVEIKHQLGTDVELERWTSSWGHLYEHHPLVRLDRQFAATVSGRLAAQIALLQPLVWEAAVPPEQRDPSLQPRGRWHRKRRS
jgi:hypothetical protein